MSLKDSNQKITTLYSTEVELPILWPEDNQTMRDIIRDLHLFLEDAVNNPELKAHIVGYKYPKNHFLGEANVDVLFQYPIEYLDEGNGYLIYDLCSIQSSILTDSIMERNNVEGYTVSKLKVLWKAVNPNDH